MIRRYCCRLNALPAAKTRIFKYPPEFIDDPTLKIREPAALIFLITARPRWYIVT
jgi:hypothetical protein